MIPFGKYYLIGLLLGMLLILSCEETIDWELQPEENGRLVVSAILTDERTIQEVRLSQSYDDLNGPVPAVTDAVVRVEVADRSVTFLPDPDQPGVYLSEFPFKVFAQLDYRLRIFWQGEEHTAVSRLAPVAPIPAIRFQRQPENPDSLRLRDFVSSYNPNQQAMYEIDIHWSHLNPTPPTQAKQFLYTFRQLDVSELIRPDREDVYFPVGSIVRVTKFGLNDDFAAYLRAMVIETDWRGGAFYTAPASIPTNISNGGLGFFSTCSIVRETVVAR